jgi:transposase InsO family protein
MFDLEIAHIPGVTNTAADALSRMGNAACCCPLYAEPEDNWKALYKADPKVRADHMDDQGQWLNPKAFHNGRLCDHEKVIVPRSKVRAAIESCHTGVLRGHWGPRKTLDLVARKYSFPNMRQLVAEFVKTCPTCQAVKPDRRGEQGLLQPLPLPTRKWQSICMDWVVGLPEVTRSSQTFNAVLTVTDRATRMVHFIPTNKMESAQDTADLMFWNIFRIHGLPRSIVSDRDSRLTSEWWQLLCAKLEIRHSPSTAYHPQTNGLAERTNQTMKQLLRAAHYNGQNWYDVLPLAEMAINNAPLPNSNYSAYYLNYGFHPCCEADLFNFNAPNNDIMENADDFLSRMQQNWRAAYHLMQELRESGREQANKHRKQHEIAV